MAPIGEAYFPPLDRCLSGEHQLLSWETCYIALSQPNPDLGDGSLRRHFSDPQTIEDLLYALSPYTEPTPRSKASFETKTSAINVTPSSRARYDIKQIQDDALWLCKETTIDEVAALRITILEWQTRSATQLLHDATADDVTYLNGVNASTGWQASSLAASVGLRGSFLCKSTHFETNAPAFESALARRQRLLEIYLAERRYILKVAEYVLAISLYEEDVEATSSAEARKDKTITWVTDLGSTLRGAWSPKDRYKGKGNNKGKDEGFLKTAIDALRSRLDAMARGSAWSDLEEVQDDLELAWAANQCLEMIHIQQILITLMESASDLMMPEVVLSWFRLMSEFSFFEGLQLLAPSLQTQFIMPLQSLASLISVAILNVYSAIDVLVQSSATGPSASGSADTSLYLLNQPAVSEVNEVFLSQAHLRSASPAVFAWSIITQHLRDIALASRESRELRQSIRAADKYGGMESPDMDGGEHPLSRGPSGFRRRSSTASDTSQQSTLLEEISASISIAEVDGDPIAYLANSAVSEGKVFDVITSLAVDFCTPYGYEHNGIPGQRMRKCLLGLLRVCVDFVQYQPALVMATMAVLTGSERYWDILDRSPEPYFVEPAATLLEDPVLKTKIFLMALSRFPYESLPFLELCRALAFQNSSADGAMPAIWLSLQEMDMFTCLMPIDFMGYKNVREDEEVDHIELTENFNFSMDISGKRLLPPSGSSRLLSRTPRSIGVPSGTVEIPLGTQGQVFSDSKPLVVAWNHEFSGLTYMGKVLQFASTSRLSTDTSLLSPAVSSDIVGEIISLITVMLSSAVKVASAKNDSAAAFESTSSILEQASDGLDRNQDIISVIFQIFETELYKPRGLNEDGGSVDVLVQCIQFTHALLPIMPDRVWPFLGRSGLLGINQDGSQLSAVVSCQEMVVGRYDFLLGCIRVFDALVEDAVANVVSRKTPTRVIVRFGSMNTLGAGISQPAMENVLLCFQRIMVDVFESMANWKFVQITDRSEITARLCSLFDKLLYYCYGVNDTSDITQKLTSPLAPAARYVLDVFLPESNNVLAIKPLLRIFAEGVATPTTSLPNVGLQFQVAQTIAALGLATTLVRINKVLQQSPAHLEAQMFKAAATLARIYVAHEEYKLPVIRLFQALVCSAPANERQPPSLLGHLGTANANRFLEVLSMLDQPLTNGSLSTEIWKLLSAVVSKRQQWFALYVLTGNTPRDSLKDKEKASDSPSGRSEPILAMALDRLSHIGKIEPQQASVMLEFVSLSADFWPWVVITIEQHPTFLRSISEYAAHIGASLTSKRDRSHQTPLDYNSIQMASYIANILAMYTNHTSRSNNPKFAKMIVPHLTYLIKNAITTPSYNSSLHGNLRKNFGQKFPGCALADFKRTDLKRTSLGDSFFYDLTVANKMLAYEPAWLGKKGQGFADEVKRANVNLSVVEAQIELFHSWKSLLVELSRLLATDEKFQKIMAVAAADCLRTNAENTLPEVIFERLSESRAELAFALLQRLAEVKSSEPEVKSILDVAWRTVRSHNTNLESAFGNADAKYHRLLLKILFTSLQPHVSSTPPLNTFDSDASQYGGASALPWSETAAATTKTVLEIISTIVAQGFRSLTILLHSSPDLVLPADFALLTALLRSCLQIPGLTRNSAHLLNAFSDTQTARCASTLLSWSDQLAASTSGDPIYGELSMMFLLELSSVPALAENLAVEGVLSQVLSTNLIRVLQSRAFGPFDHQARMYSIWARGIVPFLLNLLHAVGPPMAAEVAVALNAFPHQLSQASNAFAANPRSSTRTDPTQGYITLSMALEAESLALIVKILRKFREAGASAAVVASDVEEVKWDSVQVKEDVEGLLQRRGTLRDRIVATTVREEELSRTKAVKDGRADHRLEERLVEELRGVVGVLDGGD